MKKILIYFLFILFIHESARSQVVINEFMSANISTITDEDGDYSDWIELYNSGPNLVNLSGYSLSDDNSAFDKWTFPEINIDSGERLLIFASGKNKLLPQLHTNFKIKSSGESIFLSNSDGTVIDNISATELIGDISYGRTTDGVSLFSFFNPSTPGSPNSGGIDGFVKDKPNFSVDGGYFSGSKSVELSAEIGGTIRYTTNGSIPTISSNIYSSAISISSSKVIKARIFENGKLPGPVATRSFINKNDVNDLSLPMISISADPDELFYDSQALFNYLPGDNEKQVYFELFDSDQTLGFEANAGMKIFGNCSGTGYDYQQSLALFARGKYGDGSFDYRIFREKNIKKFEAFILRNNNSSYASFDGFGNGLVQDIVDIQAYQPVIVFINGEYWGILNMMEKINEHYVASNFNIDADSIDVLNGFETAELYYHPDWPIAGTIDNYAALTDFLRNNDLSIETNYDIAKSIIDVDHYATYANSEIYMDNEDWPGNNTKFWTKHGDTGKWRWIVFDLDGALGRENGNFSNTNTLALATQPDGPIGRESTWPNPPWSTFVLRSLLENSEFENLFIATMCDLMATNFKTSVAKPWVSYRAKLVEKEISNHENRWPGSTNLASDTSSVLLFLSSRKNNVINHYKDYFGLSGTMNTLKLDVGDGGGIIKVNNRDIENYPFAGEYFEELEITLTAIPNRGFEFLGWTGTDVTGTSITLSMSQAQDISALFQEIDGYERVRISEVNYLSSEGFNTGDWVELLNASNKTVDLSGWMITDKPGVEYKISSGIELKPGECLILCNSLANFRTLYPDVNALGDLPFGFSKRGDIIQLFNSESILVDEFEYKVVYPWPEIDYNTGNTIALRDANGSSTYYGNWKRSENYGSPGEYKLDVSIEAEIIPEPLIIEVYPNPFTSNLTIHCRSDHGGEIQIFIRDINGKVVKQLSNLTLQTSISTHQIEMSNLEAGVYLITIQTPFGYFNKKIICVN